MLTCADVVRVVLVLLMAGITPAPTADGTVLPTPGDFQQPDGRYNAHLSKRDCLRCSCSYKMWKARPLDAMCALVGSAPAQEQIGL